MQPKFVCPECEEESFASEWNNATRKIFGKHVNIYEIQEKENDTFHICPKCNNEYLMINGRLVAESSGYIKS